MRNRCSQIDYALDGQWIMWTQEAMRRILVASDKPLGSNQELIDDQHRLGSVVARGPRQDFWCPAVTPVVPIKIEGDMRASPEDFGLQTLFGACTQALALEDDIFDLSMVSEPLQTKQHLLPDTAPNGYVTVQTL
jgi:hypothetical protein